jgi:hypothetical protein
MSNKLASVQEAIGALLLTWQRYEEGKSSADEVDFNLRYLARKASVEVFGAEGEQVSFNPFEHFLIETPDNEVTQVKVIEAGVRAVRDDGSKRMVRRALVTTET